MSEGIEELTEKEKQTLRLMLRGYDAKSMARHLDLSIHTINERLRCARRKLGVSSSREAARLLTAWEGPAYNLSGDEDLGEAGPGPAVSANANGKSGPFPGWIIGGMMMIMTVVAALALFAAPQTPEAEIAQLAQSVPTGGTVTTRADADTLQSARDWLSLVDQGRWGDSYALTGKAFQELNTQEVWTNVSEQVRTPLGAVTSRIFLEQESVPVPPNGVQVVRFRTSFANRADTTETLTLVREGGSWKIVAYLIG